MLNDAVQDVKDVLKEHELEWEKTGCTIMLDGQTEEIEPSSTSLSLMKLVLYFWNLRMHRIQ